jgi:hypothetical protein
LAGIFKARGEYSKQSEGTHADRQEVTTLAEGFERAREVAIANERKWRTIHVLDQARDWFFKVYGPTADLEDPTRDRLSRSSSASTWMRWSRATPGETTIAPPSAFTAFAFRSPALANALRTARDKASGA